MSGGEHEPGPETVDPASMRRFVWTSVPIFALLTAIFFWRYALSPATTVSDHGDPLLLIWIMEWVGRALVHSPRELFDAPMFRPFADTLAYSDPLLPQSLGALPLRLVGLGPIAAYNVIFLGGIAAAGVITALLFFELTNNRVAALFGAAVATFPTLRLSHLAHMQLQVTVFLPLALLLVHKVIEGPNLARTLALAATLVAAALASLYHGLFLAISLPAFALVLWLSRPKKSWPALGHLFLAAYIAACMLAPFGRVYRRAIAYIGIERNTRSFSDALDYVSVSHFADVVNVLHLRASETGPEWVGGGAAFLPPIALSIIAAMIIRRRGRFDRVPQWARDAAPYSVLGIVAISLTLGPDVQLGGRFILKNPVGYVANLPGANQIRDFQRAGFIVAIAGGALVAFGLAELARRRRRLTKNAALGFVALSTALPAFSSSLPEYRPPGLRPVYSWLKEQPDSVVIFEVPLPRRGGLESLDYLLAAAQHEKALVHGFSGYLPLTDDTLRREATGVYRPDFFRTLGLLGATHLVVHTRELAALPNGAASLARLREARGEDLVARFPDGEVYRVHAVRREAPSRPHGTPLEPLFSDGGWSDPNRDCLEVGEPARPLVLYLPESGAPSGLHFVAESSLGDVDDSLVIERSADSRAWEHVSHGPLLSTTLAAYIQMPTHLLWSDAVFSPEPGSLLRISSSRNRRLRFCGLSVKSDGARPLETVSAGALRVVTDLEQELAKLAVDGKRRTRWHSGAPQSGHEWIDVDLGKVRDVVAVVLDLGESPYDYAREIAVDCGLGPDGLEPGPNLRGEDLVFQRPRPVQVVPFAAPRSCKLLRVRQTGAAPDNYWSVAEVSVLERASATPAPVTGDRPP